MAKVVPTSFGEVIRKLRLNRDLRQAEVAQKLNLDASLLAKYEKNIRQPPMDVIAKLADFYSVDSEILVCEAASDRLALQIMAMKENEKVLESIVRKVQYLRTKKAN